MTKEEIEGGVEHNESNHTNKTKSLDVKASTGTVAASSLAVEASYVEFLNCKIYSSQDTLYRGNSPIDFKNCLIEGQTDYICGKGNVVFDSCELRWKGYSNKAKSGYITAPRGDIDNYIGYLLYNCKVTKNKSLNVKEGYFGRPWRKNGIAIFVNTILQDSTTITATGWHEMGGVQPEEVKQEYGTKLANGAPVSTLQRRGVVLSDEDAKNLDIKKYMNNWTPTFM